MAVPIASMNVQLGLDSTKLHDGLRKSFQTLNSNVAKMSRQMSGLQSSFKTAGVAVGAFAAAIAATKLTEYAGALVRTADAFNQLQAKVKNSLTDVNQFDGVFKQLVASSNRTGTAVDSVAQAFVRLRPAAERLGVTNQDLIKFNETFSKMGALAGATSAEVSNAMIQLAQGIASNRLGGDELRSVLEQMPPIAQAIADQMKIPVEKLKDVAKEGKITAEVVLNAVLGKTKEVDAQFAKLPASVDRAMNRLANSLQIAVGHLNKATGATDFLAKALDSMAVVVDNNAESFSILTAQIVRTIVEVLKANPLFWGLGDAIERLTQINGAQWAIEFASGLDAITIGAQKAANEVGRLQATIGNAYWSGGDTLAFTQRDASTNLTYDLKNRALDAQFAQREKDRIQAMMRTMGGAVVRGSASSSKIRGLPGSGDSKKGKIDPDIADAKQLIESLKSVWDKERDAIVEAERFRKKGLINWEQYLDAVRKAKRDAHDAFKIEGLKDALEAFQKPMGDFVDKFKTDLGDALSDPAFQQQLDIQQFIDDTARSIEETKRLTAARMEGVKAYELTARQIQAENDVRNLGIDLMSEEGRLLAEMSLQSLTLQDNFQKLEERIRNFGQIGVQVAGIISNGFEGMIFRGEKFRDVLKNMALDMAQLVFQQAVAAPLAKGMGSLFSGIAGSLLGGFGGIGAGLGGGAGVPSVIGALGLRPFADGGSPPVGVPSLVGERGPELFVPRTAGTIVPNHALGGGGSVVNQYITIQTIDNKDFEDHLYQNAKVISNMSVQALQRQENRRGRRGPMD